jgi:hypothetical protein
MDKFFNKYLAASVEKRDKTGVGIRRVAQIQVRLEYNYYLLYGETQVFQKRVRGHYFGCSMKPGFPILPIHLIHNHF